MPRASTRFSIQGAGGLGFGNNAGAGAGAASGGFNMKKVLSVPKISESGRESSRS